jgi:DNA-binding PadR family transcriptional regulator
VGDDWLPTVLYDEKTIYNRISLLASEGLIKKGDNKLYTLTAKGEEELFAAEDKMLERMENRKSVSPIYPKMPFDRKKR